MIKKIVVNLVNQVFFQSVFNYTFLDQSVVAIANRLWMRKPQELIQSEVLIFSGVVKELTQFIIVTQVEILGDLFCVCKSVYFDKGVIWSIDKAEIPVLQMSGLLEEGTLNHFDRIAVEVEDLETF